MLFRHLVVIALSLLSSFCALAQPIKIAGTGAAVGGMELLIAEYRKSNPQVSFNPVEVVGSSGALSGVNAGAFDLALISRPLSDSERATGVQAVEYARTPFVLAVNAKLPVNAVSHAQLTDILAGNTEQWPNGTRVRFVLRPANDTDTKIIKRLAPAVSVAMDQALSRPGMMLASTDREAAELIERTPGAIGASTLGAIMSESRAITVLALNGQKPSVQALASGAYPLHKPLFVVRGKREPTNTIRHFMDFLATPQAQTILQRTGHLVPPFSGS